VGVAPEKFQAAERRHFGEENVAAPRLTTFSRSTAVPSAHALGYLDVAAPRPKDVIKANGQRFRLGSLFERHVHTRTAALDQLQNRRGHGGPHDYLTVCIATVGHDRCLMHVEREILNRLLLFSWQSLLPSVWFLAIPKVQEGADFQYALGGYLRRVAAGDYSSSNISRNNASSENAKNSTSSAISRVS
jgi:hypothetical protein